MVSATIATPPMPNKKFHWGKAKRGGCWARAGLIEEDLKAKHTVDYITSNDTPYMGWGYHVAARVKIGDTHYIIDPFLNETDLMTEGEWREALLMAPEALTHPSNLNPNGPSYWIDKKNIADFSEWFIPPRPEMKYPIKSRIGYYEEFLERL